jgi:BirA family transcriptional regulator, biotin operon repressor / biotin---[acetyl-CoA-carboxylase] ligase
MDALRQDGWLRQVHWRPEVGSTSDWAREFVPANLHDLPAIFVANRQTKGRGRNNRQWWSPDGCLMWTLALPSSLLPRDQRQWSRLALVSGISLAQSIEELDQQIRVQLKWPNDLYLADRKAGGILIESFTPGGHPPVILIGVGLNVDVDWQQAPSEIQHRATCLSTQLSRRVDLSEILCTLVSGLAADIDRWKGGSSDWIAAWRNRCYLTGRKVVIRTGDKPGTVSQPHRQPPCMGLCEGIADDGQLQVRQDNGEVQSIAFGEVHLC